MPPVYPVAEEKTKCQESCSLHIWTILQSPQLWFSTYAKPLFNIRTSSEVNNRALILAHSNILSFNLFKAKVLAWAVITVKVSRLSRFHVLELEQLTTEGHWFLFKDYFTYRGYLWFCKYGSFPFKQCRRLTILNLVKRSNN